MPKVTITPKRRRHGESSTESERAATVAWIGPELPEAVFVTMFVGTIEFRISQVTLRQLLNGTKLHVFDDSVFHLAESFADAFNLLHAECIPKPKTIPPSFKFSFAEGGGSWGNYGGFNDPKYYADKLLRDMLNSPFKKQLPPPF